MAINQPQSGLDMSGLPTPGLDLPDLDAILKGGQGGEPPMPPELANVQLRYREIYPPTIRSIDTPSIFVCINSKSNNSLKS